MRGLAVCAALLTFTAGFGQTVSFSVNDTAGVASGPDAALIASGAIDSFDILMTTTSDWVVLDLEVDVTPLAQSQGVEIWHASDQTDFLGNGDLDVPLLPGSSDQSKVFDTFLAGAPNSAATGYFVNNTIANASWNSSPTGLWGFAADGVSRIPLSIFNTTPNEIGSYSAARLSFNNGGLILTTAPVGVEAVTITGAVKQADNPTGTPFSYTLYQAPEPSAVLMLLAGVAVLRRR